MAKKSISIILVSIYVILVSSLTIYANNVSFPDLDENHWAYKYVSVLVNEGTVKGNQSGEFEPTKMVTKAEFVKMIGKGPTLKENDYNDVPNTHWGYDYIMTSGLSGDENNNFNPSVAMTRGQTIELLWSRAGKPTGIIAPSIIKNQADNKDAVSWIYMYGVMVGSDGVNLRLNDPISRAEVATLIIRAREINQSSSQINFVDTISPSLLETVYKSVNLFDVPYEPDKTITNGEMARAAVRLASEEFNLTYIKFPIESPFEHNYAKDLAIIGKAIGQDKVNVGFVDQNATNADTATALIYATLLKARTSVSYGNTNNYYKDLPTMEKTLANTCLTFAYESGIQLYSNGFLKASDGITLKNVAALILQLDDKVGLQSVLTTDVDSQGKSIGYDMKLEKNVGALPQNWEQFACVLNGIPLDVYNIEFENMPTLDGSFGKNPRATYGFAREYSSMFVDVLKQYKEYLSQKHGIDVRFTYIPSLVCDNNSGYVLRIKCEIINTNGKSIAYKDVFKGASTASSEEILYNGMVFFADATTDYTIGTGDGGMFSLGKIRLLLSNG